MRLDYKKEERKMVFGSLIPLISPGAHDRFLQPIRWKRFDPLNLLIRSK